MVLVNYPRLFCTFLRELVWNSVKETKSKTNIEQTMSQKGKNMLLLSTVWIYQDKNAVSAEVQWLLLLCRFCSIISEKNPSVITWAFFKRNVCLDLLSPFRHCFCHTRHHFHRCEHCSVSLLCSPLSGIKVLLIGVIIPLYADSLSLNPLRSTLCHAWLTCLRWCQILAVSRRLPYATVLLSPLVSVKRMSAWVWRLSMARRAPRNTLTVTYCTSISLLWN